VLALQAGVLWFIRTSALTPFETPYQTVHAGFGAETQIASARLMREIIFVLTWRVAPEDAMDETHTL